MDTTEIKISDSATLWAVNTDKFKKNILTMSVFLPINSETTPKDLLFPGILLRGTEGYPTNADVKRKLEELYAVRIGVSNSYYGDSLMIGYSAEFLNDKAIDSDSSILSGVINLLSEIWHKPATEKDGLLRCDEVRMAKNALCDSIRAEINNTAAYASNRCREMLCPGEPYGYSVTEEDVNSITPEQLTERYHKLRDSAYITFFYVGAYPADEVASMIKSAFPKAPLCNGRAIPDRAATQPADPVFKDVQMPVSQGKLIMGFTTDKILMSDTTEYYAMCLMTDVFGGSPSSKLFINVREKLSLCYYCGTYYENFKGIIYVSSGIDTANRELAQNEILHQLSDMQNGNITNAELSAAVKAIENSYRQIEDSPYSIISFCFGRLLLGLDTSPVHFIERMRSIHVADIVKAAGKIKLKAVYFLAGTENGQDGGQDSFDEE